MHKFKYCSTSTLYNYLVISSDQEVIYFETCMLKYKLYSQNYHFYLIFFFKFHLEGFQLSIFIEMFFSLQSSGKLTNILF